MWRKRAKCLGMDPNQFVPTTPGGSLKRVYEVCNGSSTEVPCPVRAECRQFAEENELVGVFGGVMHSQRKSRALPVVIKLQDARPA